MKNYTLFLYSALLLITVTSCELNDFEPTEWAIDPELELSESGMVVSSAAETRSVNVTTNYNTFTASSNQAWCKANADTKGRTVNINIDANETAEQRQAVVTVTIERGSKSLKKDFTVYQIGGSWDIIEGTDIRMRWSNDVTESQKSVIKRQLQQLVFVEGGTFMMGAQNDDPNAPYYDFLAKGTNPPHQVTLSDFYIGKYEVTQEQWAAVMTTSPSTFVGGNKPVENISWYDAQEYISKLVNLTGLDLYMPTSAQWEYAARGGRYSMGYRYSGSDNVDEVAHYLKSGTPETSPLFTTAEVGQKKPNELGLYDMTGNVEEMCSDWFDTVSTENQTNPTGPTSGVYKVGRGGDFDPTVTVSGCVFYVGIFVYVDKIIDDSPSYCGIRIVMKK